MMDSNDSLLKGFSIKSKLLERSWRDNISAWPDMNIAVTRFKVLMLA